jgi:endonuclease/exonuclease/phosphatase family metal-dependent hydrolase
MSARGYRIVSYNVRYFGHALRGLASTRGSKRLIAQRLSSLDPLPDIVCLQEVETISLRSRIVHSAANGQETQLEAFMAELEQCFQAAGRRFPFEAFYFRAHAYGFERAPIYTTGLAVIVNAETFHVAGHNCASPEHITHHHVERWKDRKQSRICAHMRLTDQDGRGFHVFNTHLSLPTPFTRAFWSSKEKMGHGPNQLEEARKLVGFVQKHAGVDPFIVCGDFNSPPGSPVYRFLTREAGFTGAQACLHCIDETSARGYPTAGFMNVRMHLDHLFSGGGVRWVDLDGSCAFGDEKGLFHGMSDHVPLIGRFDL